MPRTRWACSVGRRSTTRGSAGSGRRLAGGRAAARAAGEALLDGVGHRPVVAVAGHRHHDVARAVVLARRRPGSRSRPSAPTLAAVPRVSRPERVVGEERAGAALGDQVGRLVGVHQDLVQDDLALGLDVVRPQGRVPHDLAQDVEPERQVARPGAGCRRPCTPWW